VKANWLDRAIAWTSPAWGAKRIRNRIAANVLFSYEGARRDRRTGGWTTAGTSADAEIGPDLVTLRDRSRDLVRNNAYAAAAVDELVAQCVGTGITAQPQNPRLAEAWKLWINECDAYGQQDFYGLQDLVTRTVIESGECLIRMRPRKSDDGLRIPMQIQVLEPDYLDHNRTGKNGANRVIQGVEFDPIGRRVAYWLFGDHPGDNDSFGRFTSQSYRVPAEGVLHVYRKRRTQVRGVPWLAPVMMSLRDQDEYFEAAIVKKKIEACFSAIVVQNEGPDINPVGSTATNSDGQLEESMEPGMIRYLRPGEDIKFGAPPAGQGDGYREFMRDLQCRIASGIGVTYEQLTGDLSNVNYSSYRAGHLSFRAKMDQFRWLCLVPMFLDPVYKWFVNYAVASGFGPEINYDVEWSMPGFASVDPEKDARALVVKLRSGLKTWPQAIGEEGYDPDEQLGQIAEWNKKIDATGAVFDCDPRKRTAAGQRVGERRE
jgi:lambda family phage portal protein